MHVFLLLVCIQVHSYKYTYKRLSVRASSSLVCVCVCVPASTRLSEGRTLPQYWDTPVHHSRPQHIDGLREDKHRPRPCWCSWGPLLSTRLSEGRTCGQTYNTIRWTEQHHGLNVGAASISLDRTLPRICHHWELLKKKKCLEFNEGLFVIFVLQLNTRRGYLNILKRLHFCEISIFVHLMTHWYQPCHLTLFKKKNRSIFKKVKLLLLRQKDALASQSLYVYSFL